MYHIVSYCRVREMRCLYSFLFGNCCLISRYGKSQQGGIVPDIEVAG